MSPESLADIDDITLTIRSLDENDQTVDKIVDFNVAFWISGVSREAGWILTRLLI